MSVKIQLKRTTASAWTSLNPTLDNGEFGYETDTAKFKIGNGSTAWTSLAYANANLSVASLDALSDVTITSATNGDFLRWNGSAWINDAVNLATDTIGSYVESLVAGTGVTLSNNSGEGSTPTVAIGQDVASSATPTFAGLNLNGNIVFEGTTANDFETTISVTDPTADRTITFPDLTGTVVTTGDTGSVTSLMIADGAIVNADVNASAAIAHSKLANATAGQVLLGTTTTGVVTATTISGDITIDGAGVASIASNSVALGTDTTGDYVSSLVAGTNIAITNNSGEGTTPTISVSGSVSSVDSISSPDFIQFDTTANTTPVTGLLGWDSVNGTLNLGLSATKHIHIGEESLFRVRNTTGTTIGKGTALYASGVESSGRIQVTPYVADGTIREVRFMGLASESIADGVNGFVQHFGHIRDLDTRGTSSTAISVGDETWAAGDILYVHPTVPGKLTNVAPRHAIVVALLIVRHQTTGWLFVRSSSGGHIGDIHDIVLTSPTDGQFLRYDSASTSWVNDTINLGTDTTGDYVASLVAGTGVTLTNNSGETATPTVAIGQAVGTTDNVTFAGVTADAITIGVTAAGEIDTTSGNLTIDSAGGTVTIDDNLTVTGDLTVSGTTTSINTETLTVDDNIIVLNNNVTGSPTENAGIEVERGTSANVSVRWNETNDKWEVTNDGTTYGNVVSTSDTGTIATAMIADSGVTTAKINDLAVTVGKINDLAITNAKISESAAIVDTKLATISTAGKVSNSATTATDANTANAIVARDASGNFTAGTITGALSGNASTATTLATARNIAGQSFNGSANISIAPTDLTGVTSTAAEINILDGATLSTAELNILDGVTASASELNILDGASLTTTELNYVDGVTSAIQTQIDTKAPTSNPTFTGTVSGISKAMVGLGNVDNTSDANKPVSTAQQNAIDLKANINSPTFTGTVSGINSTMVGLGSVNNTSDQDKPISTATQTALDLKAPLASPTFSGTPSLPTGTTAVTQTAGNNTTALATTAFIQTALGNYRRMTASDTAPSVDVTAGDFWYDTTGLNLYIYVSSAWVQVTIDEPIFFELSELIGVVIDEDLATNQTLRFDGVSGNWVNSFPRQNVSNSSLTTYEITSANNGGIVVLDSSSAVSVNLGTWTDANIGEKVDIVQKGTGQVSITVSGAVSVVSPSNSVTTRVRYSTVTATCIGANLFLLSGDLA
jgi:hypothetical protein